MTQKHRILVVDDSKSNLDIISDILKGEYSYRTAKSGAAALKLVKSFKPGIILLDIMMPGMDGYEVCEIVKGDETTNSIKVILVSAKGLLDDRLKGYEVGADDYLQKPYDEDELLSKIMVFARLNEQEEKINQLNRLLLKRQQDIPNTLFECDKDLNFTFIDDKIESILGYSPEEILGQNFTELLGENKSEFDFKILSQMEKPNPEIRSASLGFAKKTGEMVTLQVHADGVFEGDKKLVGIAGIIRDMSEFMGVIAKEFKEKNELVIRIDQNCNLSLKNQDVQSSDSIEPADQNSDLFCDPETKNLIQFAFNQKEDVPFPIELELASLGLEHQRYTVELKFLADGPCLEGLLIPSTVDQQIRLVSKELGRQQEMIKDQEEALKNAVVMDEETQHSILKDANNLAADCLSIIKALEVYSFPDDGPFEIETYSQFVFNRNLQIYGENLKSLGNKIHGLKGNCGFLISEAKQICHKMEDVTRPLTDLEIILTQSLSSLLKRFIFKIEELLEKWQKNPEYTESIDSWLREIEGALEESRRYVGSKSSEVKLFITNRSKDKGEIRTRKKDDYISVNLQGFESLSEKLKELYYLLADSISGEQRVQAGNLFNEFLNIHQQIKKVPIVLTRYERLIPNLAKDYGKETDILFFDHQVKADREFWDKIHEILNHMLKNAVIHGIEMPEERRKSGKEQTGRIEVELKENALQIFLTISDDGKGIDISKVSEKALNSGIVNQDQLSRMSEDEILELLFLQGISTADNLDDNAGRGVGMNAVKEMIHQSQGEMKIVNTPGKGCKWQLSFKKRNVSLPCFIITIDDVSLAIPEDYIETFIDYNESLVFTVNEQPAYNYNGKAISLVDAPGLFEVDALKSGSKDRSLMILKFGTEKKGLIINEILHHSVQPILPSPKIYRDLSIYQGITIFNNNPVQVVNVDKLD